MTNSGDAAETVVRVMLTGTEITLRLTASAAKNLLALSVALAKQHKQISGKTRMKKILKDTRDIRVFPMTRAQSSVHTSVLVWSAKTRMAAAAPASIHRQPSRISRACRPRRNRLPAGNALPWLTRPGPPGQRW